ncbi:MAG: hypothetical protein DWP95_12770 [Proteobacteria bacterium]|nr:MAG: hypothetical protein DWP95_12770 [Pseudomonadota bacterium]
MPDKLHSLKHIKFLTEVGLLEARPIRHGLNNHSYHVITEQGHYFVRLNAVIAGVDRHREAQVLDLIEPLNISPKVILNDTEQNVLITQWHRGNRWQNQDFNRPSLVRKLAQQLKSFHAIPCPQTAVFKHSRLDHRLLGYADNQKDNIKKHINRHIDKLDEMGFWQANQSLTHFDLNPRNIIGRQPPMLVDWEFAGIGHPLIDWLIIEYESAQSLDHYYRHYDDNNWLPPLRALIQIMMQIWAK